MTLEADTLPLQADADGTIRVARTRITLDVLLGFYLQGQSADELRDGFPSLCLADIHSVIGYYLRHKESIDAYLQTREKEAASLRAEIEGSYSPERSAKIEAMKARRPNHVPGA